MPPDWPPATCIDCGRHPPVGEPKSIPMLSGGVYKPPGAFNPRCLHCHDRMVRAAEAAGGAKAPAPGEPAYTRRIGR